jgi:hypothetical protein
MTHVKLSAIAVILMTFAVAFSQSGGPFEITESVVGAAGGPSSDGIFDLDGTAGQAAAGGAMAQNPFSVTSGFWNFTSLAPTAANVSVSGRVTNTDGLGLPQASLRLQTQDGEIFYTRTSSFGFYRFEGIAIGQSIFVTVSHRQYVFEPRSLMVGDEIVQLDFVAIP